MTEPTENLRNTKRRRTILLSVSLLALCAAGGLGFSVVERVRDAADRAH